MGKPGKFTAMISSTAADLPEHRKQAIDACLREGVFPIGMEHLPARDATGIQASLEMVDQADIYIGIYAYHHGFTNAQQILAKLGASEPKLPPFDASKFEPMPDVELNPKDEFWVDPDSL